MTNRWLSTFSEKVGEQSSESQDGRGANSKPLKEKTSKAERRALQEAQRAAKAAAKGDFLSFISHEYNYCGVYLIETCLNVYLSYHEGPRVGILIFLLLISWHVGPIHMIIQYQIMNGWIGALGAFSTW